MKSASSSGESFIDASQDAASGKRESPFRIGRNGILTFLLMQSIAVDV
jgi:hypothetical protein